MKQYLIPEEGQFYKANLHCHTVQSDGKMTAQEVKDFYTARGYSIVAYTDHNVLISHQDLADENFLPLNGFEIDICGAEGEARKLHPTCHLCMIALEPDNLLLPFYHRTKYLHANAANQRHLLKIDENAPDYERIYDAEHINEIISGCRERGFFVTYNHPTWSHERYPQYMSYQGMNAMEIMNYGCLRGGYDEYNHRVYDDFLCEGRRMYAIAADDNHHDKDAGGCFTMIKAESLDYRTVTKAMEAGHFYSTQGPKINSLWVEDGRVYITCDKAKAIVVHKQMVRRDFARRAPEGEYITETSFPVYEDDGYFRLTVIDENGLHANTNAYFVDDIIK